MNKSSFHRMVVSFAALTFMICIVVILPGCATTAEVVGPEKPISMTFNDRKIVTHLQIVSEPPGAKIYIEGKGGGDSGYAGVTPLEVSLVGNATVSVPGTIQYKYIKDIAWTGNLSNPTINKKSWTNTKTIDEVVGTWKINAFKDGYSQATKRYDLSESDAFHKAIEDSKLKFPPNVNDPENYNPLMIDRLDVSDSIFIHMAPNSSANSSGQQQQQQQQQQQTVVIPGAGSQSPSVRGMVMVTSTPENAEIYADGAFVGNAPANLKLSEGIHIIEVKKVGFKPYKKELRVMGSSELNLRVTLETE